MAYSTLNILQKAGQLLHFQYSVESEVSDTGQRLKSSLQQAIDEVLQETNWIYAIKLIELSPDASLESTQYGFKHGLKLPNDCVKIVGLYPFFMKEGKTMFSMPINHYIVGMPYNFDYNYRRYVLKSKRINNIIYADVDKLLLEYVSNSQDIFAYVNEIWFINLVAYRLAIIVGYTTLNTNDLERLEQKYSSFVLPSAINKNNIEMDKNEYLNFNVYPYAHNNGLYY